MPDQKMDGRPLRRCKWFGSEADESLSTDDFLGSESCLETLGYPQYCIVVSQGEAVLLLSPPGSQHLYSCLQELLRSISLHTHCNEDFMPL